MLSLDEAIKHCEEKAEELKNIGFDINTRFNADTKKGRECYECAKEHEQLADWLKELKELRETMEMIKKHYILVEKGVRDNPNDLMIGRVMGGKE